MEEIDKEVEYWKKQMRRTDKEELAFVCWGIATGLMIARDILNPTWERTKHE